jgi:hypothetical protein
LILSAFDYVAILRVQLSSYSQVEPVTRTLISRSVFRQGADRVIVVRPVSGGTRDAKAGAIIVCLCPGWTCLVTVTAFSFSTRRQKISLQIALDSDTSCTP